MAWSKPYFYYKTDLTTAGLTATTADANYPVGNMLDGFDGTLYKGTTAATHYITFTGSASITCDYLAFGGDNLAGATVALEFSNDNFVTDTRQAFTAFVRSGSAPVLTEFSSISGQYSRLVLTNLVQVPQIALCWWGQKVELEYATANFDPHQEKFNGNRNVTQTGYLSGVHQEFYERVISFMIEDADATTYAKVADWWTTVDMKCFFFAWEKTDHATDAWIVRPDEAFNNPLKQGGAYRDITINLRGRR